MPEFISILKFKDETAASAVEYAVLITLITAVIVVTVSFLGQNTRDAFDSLNYSLADSSDTPPPEDDKCKGKDSTDDGDCGGGND